MYLKAITILTLAKPSIALSFMPRLAVWSSVMQHQFWASVLRPRGNEWRGDRSADVSILQPAPPHRLQNHAGQQRRREVHHNDDREDRHPRSEHVVHKRRDRPPKHRTDALRHVEKAVVGGRVPCAVSVGEG